MSAEYFLARPIDAPRKTPYVIYVKSTTIPLSGKPDDIRLKRINNLRMTARRF
jgi:hypothetical protein